MNQSPLKKCYNAYDFIIATYSLHHLTDDAKIQFIQLLKTLLKEGGFILIGDVVFQTKSDLEKCHIHGLFEELGFDGIFGRSIC